MCSVRRSSLTQNLFLLSEKPHACRQSPDQKVILIIIIIKERKKEKKEIKKERKRERKREREGERERERERRCIQIGKEKVVFR